KTLDSRKKKDYYATPCEMFARAFESFVFDALELNGTRCDYLVNGVEGALYSDRSKFVGNPYPAGSERETIYGKMDVFMKEVREFVLNAAEKDREEQNSSVRACRP
ncbi:hypothetical protein B1A_09545, partial [mine drainage metagenome]